MRSLTKVRELWQPACKRELTTFVFHGGARVQVAVESTDAWRALDQVMQKHGYKVRSRDTGGFNCRPIRGGKAQSLHSFGIACDINADTNPYREDNVLITDMPRAMVDDILAIRAVGGAPVFGWGGDYTKKKDSHHYEILASPQELVAGIDWASVKAPRARADQPDSWPTMQRGDRGPTVAKLQELLAAVGFDPVPADGAGRGVFGPRTDAQVRAYQASRKLTVNGVVGMQTWTALLTKQQAVKASQSPLPPGTAQPEADTTIEILPGMTGVAVEQLQDLLIQLGRAKGAPPGIKDTPANRDGRYLAKTQERIKEFQRANGLTPDAKVGTLTWAALRLAAGS